MGNLCRLSANLLDRKPVRFAAVGPMMNGSMTTGPSTDRYSCGLEFGPIDRQIGTDPHAFLGGWMFKFQALAVQRDALRERLMGTIEAIA